MDPRPALSAGALVIDPVTVAPEPWRNGGGMTRELWAEPRGGEDFRWRLSIADIAHDGAFSLLPGVDRTLVGLTGPQLTLTIGGRRVRVRPGQPITFDGGEPVSARRAAGPAARRTRVLNLMTARERCRGQLRVAPADGAYSWAPGTRALVLLHGRLQVDGGEVPPLGAVVADAAPGRVRARDALVAEIRIRDAIPSPTEQDSP